MLNGPFEIDTSYKSFDSHGLWPFFLVLILNFMVPINPIIHGVWKICYYMGGGSVNHPYAKYFVRQQICIALSKRGNQ